MRLVVLGAIVDWILTVKVIPTLWLYLLYELLSVLLRILRVLSIKAIIWVIWKDTIQLKIHFIVVPRLCRFVVDICFRIDLFVLGYHGEAGISRLGLVYISRGWEFNLLLFFSFTVNLLQYQLVIILLWSSLYFILMVLCGWLSLLNSQHDMWSNIWSIRHSGSGHNPYLLLTLFFSPSL